MLCFIDERLCYLKIGDFHFNVTGYRIMLIKKLQTIAGYNTSAEYRIESLQKKISFVQRFLDTLSAILEIFLSANFWNIELLFMLLLYYHILAV